MLIAAAALVPALSVAQSPLPSDVPAYAAPSGATLGTLSKGATFRTGRSANGWTMVIVEGWILTSRIAARPDKSDTLDRAITGKGAAPLRAFDGTGQPMVAQFAVGTGLKRLADRNGWTQVRRAVWVRSASLQKATGAPVAPAKPPVSAPSPASASASSSSSAIPDLKTERALRATSVHTAPGGDERASVHAGTQVEVLAHAGGWSRVRVEGWVLDRDLAPIDSSTELNVSAADLRADPGAHHGKILRWQVQIVALQTADPLRRGLAPDEPYLLALGPAKENVTLYIAVPPSLLSQARALTPMSKVLITARVRDGRSPPSGVPILDLLSVTRVP